MLQPFLKTYARFSTTIPHLKMVIISVRILGGRFTRFSLEPNFLNDLGESLSANGFVLYDLLKGVRAAFRGQTDDAGAVDRRGEVLGDGGGGADELVASDVTVIVLKHTAHG